MSAGASFKTLRKQGLLPGRKRFHSQKTGSLTHIEEEPEEVMMHYIITTAITFAALFIITKILFLGKSLSEKAWNRKGWAILDNGEYVVFDGGEE